LFVPSFCVLWIACLARADVAHRVYVSHLRNNRLFLRRTCDVL